MAWALPSRPAVVGSLMMPRMASRSNSWFIDRFNTLGGRFCPLFSSKKIFKMDAPGVSCCQSEPSPLTVEPSPLTVQYLFSIHQQKIPPPHTGGGIKIMSLCCSHCKNGLPARGNGSSEDRLESDPFRRLPSSIREHLQCWEGRGSLVLFLFGYF